MKMATRGVNKAILIGNLGNDPEVRYFPNGDAVANFSIATSEAWKDRNTGEPRERTEWHRIAIYGKLAEVAKQYLRKGSKVYIEGKLRTRKWQGQDGQDRYTTEVVVDLTGTMQMLDSRASAQDGAGHDSGGYAARSSAPAPAFDAGGPPPRSAPPPYPADPPPFPADPAMLPTNGGPAPRPPRAAGALLVADVPF